jgi:cellulose synthase/poly-beta-1,6-N-acetylglucosamine synthase-like glycosyltransferase
MNPLFFIVIFITSISCIVVSISIKKQQNPLQLTLIQILCMAVFVFCGWYFNHLSFFGIIAYSVLWLASCWISARIPTDYFPLGRVIFSTLICTIVLYVINKIGILFHLKLGWIGFTTVVIFSIEEIIFLSVIIYFTAGIIRGISFRFNPYFPSIRCEYSKLPLVSIHVPICNEPVEVVTKTLTALAKLNYPCYEVIVVDNNTNDRDLWLPIKELCVGLGFQFKHVNPHSGYKAGALNLALGMTSINAELIAVVDADNELSPEFLIDNVPMFHDPSVAYLQTAQRNRNNRVNAITYKYYPIYDYFYDITMLTRGQHNSSIFAGSAGLIRYSFLRDAGGWAEWSITEDAELSLRFLAQGYKAIYINRSYGSGLMPEKFRDIRNQWFRYFFGGLDIMIHHFRSTILARNRLSNSQRVDFALGGIISIGAAVMVLSTIGMMLTAITYSIINKYNPIFSSGMFILFSTFSNWLIIFCCYLAFGVFLLVLVFRVLYYSSWSESIRAAFSYQSLLTTQAKAALKVIFRGKQAFIKTPKHRYISDRKLDMRSILFEMILCLMMGIALISLVLSIPNLTHVFGYLLFGMWQIIIYGSTITREIQSSLTPLRPAI